MTCFPAGAVLTKLHRYFLTPPPAIERDCSYYLGITLFMAWLMRSRNVKPAIVILVTVVVGLVLGAAGFLIV